MPAWTGDDTQTRDWVLVENRHNPTTVHVRTLVTQRYKLTVYRDASYGELFDLQADPDELLGLQLEVLAWLEGLYLRLEAKSGTPEQKELFASLRARAEREKHKLARNANMLMDF